MKLAKVIPIYKSKDNHLLNKYRFITLLPEVSKVKSFIRMYRFLIINDILFQSQYGFRKKNNTTDALTEFISDTLKGFEEKEHTIAIFLDLSKAFDTIDHSILLNKLDYYGIRCLSNKWLENYLTDRYQRVRLCSENSSDYYTTGYHNAQSRTFIISDIYQ